MTKAESLRSSEWRLSTLIAGLTLAVIAFAPVHALAQTLDRIAATKTVRIGFVTDQAPFAFKGKDGAPAGYAIDLCAVITRALGQGGEGVTPQYVEIAMTEALDAVTADRVDLLCGAITATLGRREIVDFSEPIFLTGMSALIHVHSQRVLRELFMGNREISPPRSPEMTPFSVARIGVRTGTTTEATLRAAVLQEGIKADVVGFETHAEGLAALEANTIDAYFADRGLLIGLMSQAHDPGQLALGTRLFSREPYAIAMHRGDDDLRLLVDRVLTGFYGSREFAALLSKYFSEEGPALGAQIVLMSTPQ